MKETDKKIYDFKSDVLFKYSLADDKDYDCRYLLKLFIEGILNISCKSITILNPDLVVENIEDKDMLLDIRVQTNTGDYVNIEMQYSAFSKNQYQRFQIYGASLLSRQEKEGNDYQKNINHVYQIIFIDDIDKANLKLYDRYESRNEEGKLEKYNLLTRVYVQMPYINLIKKQKKLEEFSEIEKGIYIFENGITDDIIRLKENNKVVEIMKEKIERFNQDEQLRDMAYKRSLNRWANERDKQDMYEKGKEEGIEEGIKQGIEQGLEMGIEQGKYNLIKQLFNKYYPEEDDSILENLNNEQYDKIFEMILDNRSINISYQTVNTKKETYASMVMVGDALIHGTVYGTAHRYANYNGYDFKPMLEHIKERVKDYDLAYYNQETILGGTEIGLSDYPTFNSPQEFGDAMIDAGFNIVNLATNHTLDRGEQAVINSANYWKTKDVLTAGSYASFEEASKINIKEKNGIKYALLSYTYGTNGIKVPEGKEYSNDAIRALTEFQERFFESTIINENIVRKKLD